MNLARRYLLSGMAGWILLSGASRVAAGEGVMLRPKFTAGDKAYIEVDRNILQKFSGPMGEGVFKIRQMWLVSRKVESVKGGAADLEMRFERGVQSFDSPMMDGMFDTDDPDNEDASTIIGSAIKPMIGMAFKIGLDEACEVKTFSGMDAIREKVEESAAGSPLAGQMLGELGDDRARREWGTSMYVLYPNKEVKPGDTWSKSIHDTVPRLGAVVYAYDCKLDRLSEDKGRKVAIVSFTGTMEKDTSKGKDEGHVSTIDGKFSGTATFDIEKGQFVTRVQEGRTRISMGQGPGGGRRPSAEKKEEEGEDDEEKDTDAKDDASAPEMKIDLEMKQTISLLSEQEQKAKRAEDAKKREAEAKKADEDEDDDDDDDAKASAGKKDKGKPAKKDDNKDDDE